MYVTRKSNAFVGSSKESFTMDIIEENICIAFYPDNDQTLSRIAYNFFKNQKISVFGNFGLLKYIEYPKTTIWNKVERITD